MRRDAPVELLGPLGCGLQTGAGAVLNVMQPRMGQSIAVYGVGGVGLAGLMAAKIAGCDPIIAVDRLAERLKLARELGATHALESRGGETLAEIRKRAQVQQPALMRTRRVNPPDICPRPDTGDDVVKRIG